MTDAPKEIWISSNVDGFDGQWGEIKELYWQTEREYKSDPIDAAIRYIRADIAELWMDMRYLEGYHSGLELAAAMLEDRASLLRDPNTYNLPAMPGKIICEDRARTLERSAIDIRNAMEEDND